MPPVNDDFANATSLTGAVGSTSGSNAGATAESGEPSPWAGTGTNSVWWKWTAPSSGEYVIDLSGSAFDTVLEVYTGSAVGALTFVAADDDSGAGATSRVIFTAIAGTTYRLRVHGYSNTDEGAITLAWQPNINPPNITGLTPSSGLVGTTVAITGTDLGAVDSVTICGADAVFVIDSSTHITATVPDAASGANGPVAVANAVGSDSFIGFTPLHPGPWIQPDDTEYDTILRGTLYDTGALDVGPTDGPPDPVGTPGVVHNNPGLSVQNSVNVTFDMAGTLTGWTWQQALEMVGIDLTGTVVDGVDLVPVPPGSLPPDAFDYEYEVDHGEALGPLRLELTAPVSHLQGSYDDDLPKTPDLSYDVFAGDVQFRRLATDDYEAGSTGQFVGDVWPGASVLDGELLHSWPVARTVDDITVEEATETHTWLLSDYLPDTHSIDLTIDDLDPGYRLGIVALINVHDGDPQWDLPDYVDGSSLPADKQVLADGRATLYVSYRPPRYRFLFTTPQVLGRPPVAHRQRRDGVATVGPPLAHLQGGVGSQRPDLAHRQQTP